MLGIKAVGCIVFRATEMHMCRGFALAMQILLSGLKQARSDALAFPVGFDIKPVKLHLGGARDGVIADAANHPVMVIDGQPEYITGVQIVPLHIQQVLIQSGNSAEGVLGFHGIFPCKG